jgi:hypothetical protein
MQTDLVFPKHDEKKFSQTAKSLSITRLVCLYGTIEDINKSENDIIHKMLFVDTPSKASALRLTQRSLQLGISSIVQGRDEKFNRFVIERTPALALANVEQFHSKDHLHFRRSGLDQVLCKLLAREGKGVLVSLRSLLDNGRSKYLGRVQQNVSFCNKYNIPYGIVSFAQTVEGMRGSYDLRSLLVTLGMEGKQWKMADEFFKKFG